jgi:acyl-CoA reductase-like NAD-dependent aldehyde dehydrogenase
VTPAVILNPKRDSALMQEEIFGPLLPIITLVIYYFGTKNGANYKRVEQETSSGALVTNEIIMQDGNLDLPFGGVGQSGYGRYHGYEGFKSFSNMKSMLIKSP